MHRGLRRRFAWWLRNMGDRVDPTSGPRYLSVATVTVREGVGCVFHDSMESSGGLPLWFMQEDYDHYFDDVPGGAPLRAPKKPEPPASTITYRFGGVASPWPQQRRS